MAEFEYISRGSLCQSFQSGGAGGGANEPSHSIHTLVEQGDTATLATDWIVGTLVRTGTQLLKETFTSTKIRGRACNIFMG